MGFTDQVGGATQGGCNRWPACQTVLGSLPFQHEPDHLGSPTPRVLLALLAWPEVLETFLELVQQPSCKVVLVAALLLGGGSLMLWVQRKRRKKITAESVEDDFEAPESCKAKKEHWIKSHFSRISDEKLETSSHATTGTLQPEGGGAEASTRIQVETFTTRHGEGGTALQRESFTSKKQTSGSSVIKETHKEYGKSSSTDEATWATVAACVKEIDCKGRHLANSMLQRATTCQHLGHLEAKDINLEELKALEEVEMKLKGGFLIQQEDTIAGMNHTQTFQGHGNYSHQSHQGHPTHQSHQGHPTLQSHQAHPGHQSHQVHPGYQNHQVYPTHQNHPGHQSHQSHSTPNRSHQIYDPFEAT